MENKKLCLIQRPIGSVQQNDFAIQQEPIPQIHDGEVLIRNQFISLDPAMRGWMSELKSYVPPVPLGQVMRAYTGGVVVESKNPNFKVL